MASVNNSLIGAIRAEATLEGGKFVSGAKKIQQSAKQTESQLKKSFGGMSASVSAFGKSLIAGLSVGLIAQGVRAALDYAGSLGEVAQQLGVTTKELQVFRFAVQQNGGTVENADQALGKFAIAISKALSGSKQATAAFQAMGVSLSDLQSKSKTELIGQIADGMKKTGGASANAAAGVALFGRGFQKIIPVLDQGSAGFNELAAAAEELGIVLSDEQIQKADHTTDKLDALATVLKAQIAGEVADNADSILDFANALGELVSWLEKARAALVSFQQNYNLPNLLFGNGAAFGLNTPGRSVTIDVPRVARARAGGGGGAPNEFLGGGGGGRKSKRAPRDTSLRDAFQFEEEQRRADMDILRAKEALAHDYSDRRALSIQMLELERESFEAELKYGLASEELTQAQADAKRLKFEEVDHLRRMAVIEEENEQRLRDYNMLDDRDADAKMELLEMQARLVETASERRDIELKILNLAYEDQRRRLERIIRESQDWAKIEAARRDLLDLSKRQSLDRAGVIQGTRGPMEDWLAQLPTTAAKAQEAMEQLQVQGFDGLIDAALALSEGFGSAKDALLNTLKQFLLGLARMELQKLAGSLISGGIPGFASGGSFMVGGVPGIDKNIMSIGGLPVARVSYGERVSISNDNDRAQPNGNRGDVNFNIYGVTDGDSFRRNERQITRSARRKLGVQ